MNDHSWARTKKWHFQSKLVVSGFVFNNSVLTLLRYQKRVYTLACISGLEHYITQSVKSSSSDRLVTSSNPFWINFIFHVFQLHMCCLPQFSWPSLVQKGDPKTDQVNPDCNLNRLWHNHLNTSRSRRDLIFWSSTGAWRWRRSVTRPRPTSWRARVPTSDWSSWQGTARFGASGKRLADWRRIYRRYVWSNLLLLYKQC